MTTVVNKHGLRAAGEAKRTKHTQRTPLPPRGPVPAEEVRKRANERAEALRPATESESKSTAKGKAFAEGIKPFGWDIKPAWGETDVTDHVTVTATRGAETIFIEWMGGVFQPTATYTIADRTVSLRNASAARTYAARSPEDGAAELSKVAANRFFRKRAVTQETIEARKSKLPFDPAEATESEITTSLAGQRVVWHNRFREEPETAYFPRDMRQVHFTEYGGERIVNFCCGTTGYRSFRLAALLQVGRGRVRIGA